MIPLFRRVLPLAAFALLPLLAACGTSNVTASPAGPTVVASPSIATEAPDGSSEATPPGPTQPSQTDTDWGRIWDAVPAAFPKYPGSIPTEAVEDPVSASFAVGAAAKDATDFMVGALQAAGYSIGGAAGPFEDGSYVISATAGADCRVEVRLTPLSGTTHMSVLFGAGCPFE